MKSGHGVPGVIAASHVVLENRLKLEFVIDADILDADLIRKGNNGSPVLFQGSFVSTYASCGGFRMPNY